MTTTGAPSQAAENTRALLNRTLASYESSLRQLVSRPRGRLEPPDQPDSRVQELRQGTLIRLLSVTESFTAELLWREAEWRTAAPAGSLTEQLTVEAVIAHTSTWVSQETAFRGWLGVKVDWALVGGYADVRNAAAHGLGRLTRRQLKNEAKTVNRMNQVGVAVEHRSVMLTDDNIKEAAQACLTFVLELDEAAATARTVP